MLLEAVGCSGRKALPQEAGSWQGPAEPLSSRPSECSSHQQHAGPVRTTQFQDARTFPLPDRQLCILSIIPQASITRAVCQAKSSPLQDSREETGRALLSGDSQSGQMTSDGGKGYGERKTVRGHSVVWCGATGVWEDREGRGHN